MPARSISGASETQRPVGSLPEALRPGRLGRRILRWSLGIALGPMLLLAGQGHHCAREAILDTAVERLTELTASRKARLELWLSERLADAAFLAACPYVKEGCRGARSESLTGLGEPLSGFLRVFATKFGIYDAIGLYDASWHEIASVGTDAHGLSDFDLSGIRETVRSSMDPAVGRIHRHPDQRLGMHFGAPVLGPEKQAIGYVLTALDYVRSVKHILNDGTGLGTSVRCYLVSTDGLVLTGPDGPGDRLALSLQIGTEGFRRGNAGELGAAVYRDYRDQDVVGGFASIPLLHGVLLIEQDAAEGLAWLSRLLWRAGVTALLVALLVVLLSYRTAGRISEPLQRLAAVAKRVAEGAHDARVAPVVQPEADAIGKALNHMLDELAVARERVVQTATLAVMGELSSAVVHEMRNPLSSIKLNLRALSLKLRDDVEHAELARIAEEQVGRLERMLSDLLSLGKPLTMNVQLVPLRDVVAAAADAVAEDARRRHCRLRFQDEAPGARVQLDPERMRQALVNLLQNALEAIGDGGEVIVRATLDGPRAQRAVLEVLDDGPGIPEDNLDRLFKPFFTTRADGTGLGLAIVRKIVEYHGGHVSAANRAAPAAEPRGAVFRIELPHDGPPEVTNA